MKKKKLIYSIVGFLLALLATLANMLLAPEPVPPSGDLTIHFIDVGQADCALLECGGEYMIIDGGNIDDGQLVISYLQQQGVEELAAVVCSHAHEDHVGGLPSVLAVFPTKSVYAPTKTYSSKVFDDFLYYADQQRLEVTIPAPGDTIPFGEVSIQVLGPVQSYAETNDTSIILRIDHGESSFLFTGDMEVAAENDMLDYWNNDALFDVDVLKMGHHGSDTSTGYRFLNAVMPEYSVISVGEGNSYGHPHKEPMARLKQAGVVALRTDHLGHILATSDGTQITFTWEKQNAQPEDVEPAQPITFIGNINSKILHTQDCSGLPGEEKRIYFDSYKEAIEAGYTPHERCMG